MVAQRRDHSMHIPSTFDFKYTTNKDTFSYEQESKKRLDVGLGLPDHLAFPGDAGACAGAAAARSRGRAGVPVPCNRVPDPWEEAQIEQHDSLQRPLHVVTVRKDRPAGTRPPPRCGSQASHGGGRGGGTVERLDFPGERPD